ncbi:TonB-dependent receptor [Salegentibacter sp. JZCK2]|uniref:TonB-dependent receptor n=1 Tax=Salegentibacter tibetensis TaxID=2873600 RepID=UPI001CCA657D|nr:TonB-dependent receptor [Salegentibacter tibetensis]MBZ9731575.1 TonB-dependent receptor [Salegentibacter tibetensis]
MKIFTLLSVILTFQTVLAQKTEVSGMIAHEGKPVAYTNIYIEGTSIGTATDKAGNFSLMLEPGSKELTIQAMGFKKVVMEINPRDFEGSPLNIELVEDKLGLSEVVVSATRNRVNRKDAPVVVNVLDSKIFNATQSITVSESLNYQPGVRVETNCQNCGFTQVRLNGLDGGYSQILVNSRAVFSALNNVYGLEQIPTSILDRVEVVRSGGSALFGSNAIAGTINIITKEPVLNSWEIASNFGLIDGDTPEITLSFNASVISDDLSSGVTVLGMNRDRDAYDANGDGFTELVELVNTSIGAKAFLKPNDNSKFTLDLTALKEDRRGGDRLELAPHLTDITEELIHDTYIGGLTYDVFNNDQSNKFSFYVSGQKTDRESFYGGLGGGRTAQDTLTAINAYGNTKDLAALAGMQYTRQFVRDVLTVGAEYNFSNTEDEIAGYDRFIDQKVNSYGAFAQYEWKPFSVFTALLGGRLDHIGVDGFYKVGGVSRDSQVEQTVLSPRLTLMYDITEDLKLRGGYARGFRAPQAFSEDLHISSVGGEPSFVILSENLEPEFSNAYTASLNYTRDFEKVQTNFLLEGFYTKLENPFTPVSTGATLPNGSILEEVRNGSGAYVTGTNFEFGVSPSSNLTFQLGGTLQKSMYEEPQVLFEATNTEETDVIVDQFVRNPNVYGYFNANIVLVENTGLDLTGTYTGSMVVPRVVSDSGFLDLVDTPEFFDANIRLSHHVDLTEDFHVTFSGGVQNLFNSYQDDFDSGPTRDSDYVYGPAKPRTFFIGLKFGKLHL